MYFKTSETELEYDGSNNYMFAIILSVLIVVIMGVFPGSFIDLVTKFI